MSIFVISSSNKFWLFCHEKFKITPGYVNINVSFPITHSRQKINEIVFSCLCKYIMDEKLRLLMQSPSLLHSTVIR